MKKKQEQQADGHVCIVMWFVTDYSYSKLASDFLLIALSLYTSWFPHLDVAGTGIHLVGAWVGTGGSVRVVVGVVQDIRVGVLGLAAHGGVGVEGVLNLLADTSTLVTGLSVASTWSRSDVGVGVKVVVAGEAASVVTWGTSRGGVSTRARA